jgi:hypothetical protein
MTTANKSDYITRESMLKLLSNDEVAKVSTSETAKSLESGDEFIDLEDIRAGVKTAGSQAHMGTVLPRKAVHPATWDKIVAHLNGSAKN